MVSVPAVVIAAPASGTGKTTVATGLMGALRETGCAVAPFKVGPDYIDPGFHTLAAGRPGRNLDPVMVGDTEMRASYGAAMTGADIAVIEGVMGLFDGRIVDADQDADLGIGSTAAVAVALGAPVVLVVDAAGQGQSLAATLHGFRHYSTDVDLAGVILNRVGSARHEDVLRQACARVGLPVFGALRRHPDLEVPSRHLGLIPAAERSAAAQTAVAAMTALISRDVDVAAVRRAAQRAALLTAPAPAWRAVLEPLAATAPHPRVAIAAGPAFTFSYAEQREMLSAAGVDVVGFNPLREELPPAVDGVIIGGGFPEQHAADLSANEPGRRSLAAAAAAGVPIWAECAGLLYLGVELDGHPMAGVLPLRGTFGPTLTLGYRDAVALTDTVPYRVGERVTGHEFHRTTITFDGAPPAPAWGWRSPHGASTDGVAGGHIHASYLHVHPCAQPTAVARFVQAASEHRRMTKVVSHE